MPAADPTGSGPSNRAERSDRTGPGGARARGRGLPDGSGGGRAPTVLVVWHSRSGSSRALLDPVVEGCFAGAASGDGPPVAVAVRNVVDATFDDVAAADAVIVVTPTNFGYVAGLTKDWLERIYHSAIERSVRPRWAVVLKGDTDVDGALDALVRIVEAGMGWAAAAEPLRVVGPVTDEARAAAWELGASVTAAVALGLG